MNNHSSVRATVTFVVIMCAMAGAQLVAQDDGSMGDLQAFVNEVAALPGEPASVSAAGLTRNETPLVTMTCPQWSYQVL